MSPILGGLSKLFFSEPWLCGFFLVVVVTATENSHPTLTLRIRPSSYANPPCYSRGIPVHDVGISGPYRNAEENLAIRYCSHTKIAPDGSLDAQSGRQSDDGRVD